MRHFCNGGGDDVDDDDDDDDDNDDDDTRQTIRSCKTERKVGPGDRTSPLLPEY